MKKMTLKDKLMVYVYRKGNQIEQEERDLKTSLWLSALDNLDHYEILQAKRQIKRIMSLFLVFPPIILNIHLV